MFRPHLTSQLGELFGLFILRFTMNILIKDMKVVYYIVIAMYSQTYKMNLYKLRYLHMLLLQYLTTSKHAVVAITVDLKICSHANLIKTRLI